MHLERLRLVTNLPPDGGWRADLAVDRSSSPPRAVLVARVPATVAGDALALSRLARGLDLSARTQHPALRRLLGTGEVDGDLALVEAWREGETLRGVLDAGGPLTAPLAARVAVEVAGALHEGHTLPSAKGQPLCHGAVTAERVLLAEDGAVLLCGTGRPVGEDVTPADDLRSLARLLLECLPPANGGKAGSLQAVCDRVLMGAGYPSAAIFAEAVGAAVTPADASAVAARAEASQPAGTPAWLARRKALAQAIRAEGGVASEEVAPLCAELAEVARQTEEGILASPPVPTAAPPAATAPPPPSGEVPPPVHAAAVLHPTVASPQPAGLQAGAGKIDPLQAWLDHRQTPIAIGAVLGLLGLLIGFVLGGR